MRTTRTAAPSPGRCFAGPSPAATAAITCELAGNGVGGYYVCVVPHWNVAAAAVEQFDATLSALRRHAELAQFLRENGWELASRGTARLRAA